MESLLGINECLYENEIVRYKAWLIAQEFSQGPGFDYQETYSPIRDRVTFVSWLV